MSRDERPDSTQPRRGAVSHAAGAQSPKRARIPGATVLAALVLFLATGCSDAPNDPAGPTDPAFAKGGPNAPPTNDGRIYFGSDMTGDYDIYSINPDGTNLRRLTFSPVNEAFPTLSPDGRRMAYLRDNPGPGNIKHHIWIMNVDGSKPQLRASPPDDVMNYYAPQWSPDGRTIAFFYDEGPPGFARRMAILNVKNGEPVTLPMPGGYPTWSPDGQYIAYAAPLQYLGQIVTSRLDGSDAQARTTSFVYCCGIPKWSPDGNRILFTGQPTSSDDTSLYTARIAQSDVARLFGTPPSSHYAWSADAAKIAYSDVNGDLYVSLANGSGAQLILAGARASGGIAWAR